MLLRNKDKLTLLKIFSSVTIPLEVWAYGSRVTGEAHEGSDLDLVIRSHNLQKLPPDVLLGLKEKIQQSNIPILVELFEWARLPLSYHHNIQSQHEVLFTNMEVLNDPPEAYEKKSEEKGGT